MRDRGRHVGKDSMDMWNVLAKTKRSKTEAETSR